MAARRRRRLLGLLLALVAVSAVVVVLLARGDDSGPQRLTAGTGTTSGDPLAYDPARREDFEARAAAGLAQPLYRFSPGGVVATAERVDRLRPLVERAARAGDTDPDELEAIVFLESAGRPDAMASDDLEGAAGLTQILAQTGSDLLGMRVDVAASRRLTRRIARTHDAGARDALEARRRVVDERFDPAKALAATTRYLGFARGQLGRDDLAVVSYHMGVGNLQRALRAYGARDIPYAQLFFDSTPVDHGPAWRVLDALGDDSSTYLWRVRAAEHIMAAWRTDPTALAERADQHLEMESDERVLRPTRTTKRFGDAQALRTDQLVELDDGVLRGSGMRLSRALAAAPEGRQTLRPEAAAVLRYLGAAVRETAGGGTLVVTAATRDTQSETEVPEALAGAEATPSLHTTGYAFDVARSYPQPGQARAFQFWLDRLTALDVIAWSREGERIHVVAGPRARGLLPLLGAAQRPS